MRYIKPVEVHHCFPFLPPSDSLSLSKYQLHFGNHSSQLSYIIIMALPSFHYFTLFNSSNTHQIFPMLCDIHDSLTWDGSKEPLAYAVDPGESCPLRIHGLYLTSESGQSRTFDLFLATNPPTSGTIVILGCIMKDSKSPASDIVTKMAIMDTSSTTVVGRYPVNGRFTLDSPTSSNEMAVTFQETYVKHNSPAVAKVLVALADLISPEVI